MAEHSRRAFIRGAGVTAAAATVAVMVPGWPAPRRRSAADDGSPTPDGSVVAFVKDAKAGTITVMRGEREVADHRQGVGPQAGQARHRLSSAPDLRQLSHAVSRSSSQRQRRSSLHKLTHKPRAQKVSHVFSPRSAGDLQRPGRRQFRSLRVRQPGQARVRDDHRQLRSPAGARRRPELLRVR